MNEEQKQVLLDKLAGRAMATLIKLYNCSKRTNDEKIARRAYDYAGAMLVERERRYGRRGCQ